jgi:hypothetical protein
MDSGATNTTSGHAALELANLVVGGEAMRLEFPWVPSDQRETSFVASS